MENKESNPILDDKVTYTYADIENIMRSKEYSRANINERVDMLTPILEQLVQNGIISEYIVYMDGSPPGIKVISEDGLGVYIHLADFPKDQN